jgi:hypothetical protein
LILCFLTPIYLGLKTFVVVVVVVVIRSLST